MNDAKCQLIDAGDEQLPRNYSMLDMDCQHMKS